MIFYCFAQKSQIDENLALPVTYHINFDGLLHNAAEPPHPGYNSCTSGSSPISEWPIMA